MSDHLAAQQERLVGKFLLATRKHKIAMAEWRP
jgi:hypothetical protein